MDVAFLCCERKHGRGGGGGGGGGHLYISIGSRGQACSSTTPFFPPFFTLFPPFLDTITPLSPRPSLHASIIPPSTPSSLPSLPLCHPALLSLPFLPSFPPPPSFTSTQASGYRGIKNQVLSGVIYVLTPLGERGKGGREGKEREKGGKEGRKWCVAVFYSLTIFSLSFSLSLSLSKV